MHWPGIQLTAAIVGYIGMIKLSFYPARSFIDLHGGPRWMQPWQAPNNRGLRSY